MAVGRKVESESRCQSLVFWISCIYPQTSRRPLLLPRRLRVREVCGNHIHTLEHKPVLCSLSNRTSVAGDGSQNMLRSFLLWMRSC